MTSTDYRTIRNSIRDYYKRKAIRASAFIAFLIVMSIFFPMMSLVFPSSFKSGMNPDRYAGKNIRYVSADLHNLYFTGYTRRLAGRISGYYYYMTSGDQCVIVLLTPQSSDMGLPSIGHVRGNFAIRSDKNSRRILLGNISKDLNWNKAGADKAFSKYSLSEPDGSGIFLAFVRILVILSFTIAILTIILSLVHMYFPATSHAVRRLSAYGNPGKQLLEAEKELATLPQLATEDMFITEHWFIETSHYGVALVPIDKIIWIYKYSTLHKLLWHHFSISYTLYITAASHIYIRCPKNIKSDIDGIIDYLSEANHNILVGFTETNREKVEAIQGDFLFLRKLWKFLSAKV